MTYPEFNQYESFLDEENPLCNAYRTRTGAIFYVEPGFYVGLMGFKERREESFQRILDKMDEIVERERRVVFTGEFESPFMVKDDCIYQEIQDITDLLGIYVEDKNRPSDYGD